MDPRTLEMIRLALRCARTLARCQSDGLARDTLDKIDGALRATDPRAIKTDSSADQRLIAFASSISTPAIS